MGPSLRSTEERREPIHEKMTLTPALTLVPAFSGVSSLLLNVILLISLSINYVLTYCFT